MLSGRWDFWCLVCRYGKGGLRENEVPSQSGPGTQLAWGRGASDSRPSAWSTLQGQSGGQRKFQRASGNLWHRGGLSRFWGCLQLGKAEGRGKVEGRKEVRGGWWLEG